MEFALATILQQCLAWPNNSQLYHTQLHNVQHYNCTKHTTQHTTIQQYTIQTNTTHNCTMYRVHSYTTIQHIYTTKATQHTTQLQNITQTHNVTAQDSQCIIKHTICTFMQKCSGDHIRFWEANLSCLNSRQALKPLQNIQAILRLIEF